jgi:ribosomal protein S18 acetylase RimI-like enzyme
VLEYRYATSGDPFRTEIHELLRAADDEFTPPLSARTGTAQVDGLSTTETDGGLDPYLSECLSQRFLFATRGPTLVGFLSFRHDYTPEFVTEYAPANYPTTLVVRRSARGRGIATALYRRLLTSLPADVRLPNVVARTWSTNEASIQLHRTLGFRRIRVLENHRGDGIDTIYFATHLSGER